MFAERHPSNTNASRSRSSMLSASATISATTQTLDRGIRAWHPQTLPGRLVQPQRRANPHFKGDHHAALDPAARRNHLQHLDPPLCPMRGREKTSFVASTNSSRRAYSARCAPDWPSQVVTRPVLHLPCSPS